MPPACVKSYTLKHHKLLSEIFLKRTAVNFFPRFLCPFYINKLSSLLFFSFEHFVYTNVYSTAYTRKEIQLRWNACSFHHNVMILMIVLFILFGSLFIYVLLLHTFESLNPKALFVFVCVGFVCFLKLYTTWRCMRMFVPENVKYRKHLRDKSWIILAWSHVWTIQRLFPVNILVEVAKNEGSFRLLQ